jgi:transcriptional regulator with XRE-family HTH domain
LRVRELRERRGISQRELCRRLGVHKSHIAFIEQGSRQHISAWLAVRLAQELGTSVEYLLGITDDPRPLQPAQEPEQPVATK